MRTFDQVHADCNRRGAPCSYWGTRGHWFSVAGQSRDSDALERCNFQEFCAALEEINPDCYAVESENHWAVGWVETLLVDPAYPTAVALAETLRAKLADYPVLNDEAFSQLEYDEYQKAMDDWGYTEYRNALIKANPQWNYNVELLDHTDIAELWQRIAPELNWEYSGDDINIAGAVKATDLAALFLDDATYKGND